MKKLKRIKNKDWIAPIMILKRYIFLAILIDIHLQANTTF
jgi:hypothetical protein